MGAPSGGGEEGWLWRQKKCGCGVRRKNCGVTFISVKSDAGSSDYRLRSSCESAHSEFTSCSDACGRNFILL